MTPAGLHEAVLAHADTRPDAVAVRQWDRRLSYGELAGLAARTANRLAALGVPAEAPVAVCARRRPELVAALLGVLRTGAAYVPLDPQHPPARLAALLRQTGAAVAVVDDVGAALLSGTGCHLVELPTAPEPAGPAVPVHPDQAAYVIFTSGSTGRPKGVVISHRSALLFVREYGAFTGITAADRAIGYAALSFDAFVQDIFVPLAAGASVALVPDDDRLDPARLQRFAAMHEVTWGWLPVALYPLLDPAGLPHWRTLLVGGESIGPEQVERWTASGGRLFNGYGPAEATVCATCYPATGAWDRTVPIGPALPERRAYVVDERLRLVPPGTPGELLIGGGGLARGYLGQPGATAAAFRPDPFTTTPGARVYRTGDRVRADPDGTLTFLGRLDRQVKIRGQRVEIGEVEAVLRGHPEVGHAVADARPGPDGGLELLAFVTPSGDPPPAPEELRRYAGERLPAAMVPARVRVLDALPLTATGKVDLDRLAAPVPAQVAEAPGIRDSVEGAALADAWALLLGAPVPDPAADFFGCGGHSVAAMRLVAALRGRLARDVRIEHVLSGRRFANIRAAVAAAPPLTGGPPLRGNPPAPSPAQQRLWFLERYAPQGAAAYTIAFAQRLRGRLDHTALAAALSAVDGRQDALRWRIVERAARPEVVVDPPRPVPLPVEDLSGAPDTLEARLAALVAEPFDLAADRLWRTRLYRLGPAEHVLAVTAHHAVFDGWSESVLYRDLAAGYAAARAGRPAYLPPLSTGFADYVAWRGWQDRERGKADLAWWVAHLTGAPTVLELPPDTARRGEPGYSGARVAGWLSPQTTARLAELTRARGATLSAALLAALGLVLSRRTGQDDLLVGTPMADRRLGEFEPVVGFFVDVAPLRVRVDPAAGFGAALDRAGAELLAALAHPQPLDRLVDVLGAGGRLDRNPLVQVLFNVFNFAAEELALPGLAAEPVAPPVPGSPFDLTVYGMPQGDRVRLELVYRADLYRETRMRDLLDDVTGLLDRAVSEPDRPLDELRPRREGEPELGRYAGPRAAPRPVPVDLPVPAGAGPATSTEERVARVWCEVLGRPAVPVTENFFAAGGTSLLIVAVARRLAELFGRQLPVVELFRYPTVRALAGYLDGAGGDDTLDRAALRGAARLDRGRRRAAGRGR